MNIQEAIEKGRQKNTDFKTEKNKKLETKAKNNLPEMSVTQILQLIEAYCQLFDIQHQFRPTQKLKGQLKSWMKTWDCPISGVFGFDQYMLLMIEKWQDYCSSKFNYTGIPGTCFNISLLLDRPKLLASVNMFLNQAVEKVEPEKDPEFSKTDKPIRKINMIQI